ncbi:MAG: transglycosylase SLT domain-containing protein [Saprospiraceae bacterium]|nr:transglycosylase SLT domain-containing protein [Saprospiraceae bacterium]
MKTRALTIYLSILAGFFTLLLFSANTENSGESNWSLLHADGVDQLPQRILSFEMKDSYSFAGEALPLENFDVRERLDREFLVNSYWHSSTLLNIKQATRFFPMIEAILAEEGVPDDFKFLAVAESSLQQVTSPSGAKGVWQFLKDTGASYGLTINDEIDERYHVEKATRAACKMLKDYKKRFGSWTFAAAGYNMGSTSLAREIENQRADSYFDMNLSDETMRYIFRIVALKEIITQPEEFGFYLDPEDLYQPLNEYSVILVEEPIENWGDFAKEHGTSYRMLKVYNPWLRSYKLSKAPTQAIEIRLPK